jgi:hypothetical protein
MLFVFDIICFKYIIEKILKHIFESELTFFIWSCELKNYMDQKSCKHQTGIFCHFDVIPIVDHIIYYKKNMVFFITKIHDLFH